MEIKLYGAPWCSHCTKLKTDLVKNPFKLPYTYINIDVLVEVDYNSYSKLNITTIPTIILMENDVEIYRWEDDITIEKVNEYIDSLCK